MLALGACLTAQTFWDRGRVLLEDGSPPPAATMSICGQLTVAPRDAVECGANGGYFSSDRPCGLTVSLRGFQTFRGVLPPVDEVRIVLRRLGSEGTASTVNIRMLACTARVTGRGGNLGRGRLHPCRRAPRGATIS